MEEAGSARAVRGVAVIAASICALAVTTVLYLHPSLSFADTPMTGSAPYRVTSLDFVDPSTGWVVVDFGSGDYAVLHTEDGGLSWTRQLAGAGQGGPHYLKFFDTAVGVFGQVGAAPELQRTGDGGRTWTAVPVPKVQGRVLSWSWVDSYFGWVLLSANAGSTDLFRTEDGGYSWKDLGVPVPAPEQVFQVDFSFFTTGWLTSANAGPYAYKTGDYGDTWTRVPLPAPPGGWPHGGSFMVAVQPTSGQGVAASVVFFPPLQGRRGQGAMIRNFPPLTVRTFDGGRLVTFVYSTAIAQKNLGPIPQSIAPNLAQLVTLDDGATWTPIEAPSTPGAFGFLDAARWWWVGDGKWAITRDGGLSWTAPQSVDVQAPLAGSLVVVDGMHAWLAASDPGRPRLEATSDGGAHWRIVSLPAEPDSPTTP